MPDPNTTTPDPTPAPTAEDVANLQEALRKEREAHGSTSKQFKTIEKELNELKNSGKSESEKLAARLKELEDANADKETKLRERDAQDAVRNAATKAGATNSDVVWRSVKGDIEYDSDGKPTNVDTLVKDMKDLAPQLFRPAVGKADAANGNGAGAKPKNFDMNSQIRTMAGRGT